MSELEDVLREWLALDDYEISKCAEIVRSAVEIDQVRERIDRGEFE